jgi:hypothetical protein
MINFLLTLFIGLGTSFVIYSRYLFLHNSFQALWFSALLFFFLLFEEKKSKLRFFSFLLSSVFYINSFQALPAAVMSLLLLVWFSVFYYKEKKFLAVFAIAMLIIFSFRLVTFLDYLNTLSLIGRKFIEEKNFLFFYNVYPSTFFATDFTPVSVLYSIENNLGNAIFLKFYPLFAYFFGPRGIFLNSPFLLFSFLGLMQTKKRLKIKLILLLAFLTFFYVYINRDYEGGFIPRYVRHAEPFIFVLSIFLANYLSKEKNKFFLLIFSIFSFLSVTNCLSLSIRTDWSYEKITDLISSDIVVWPWLSIKQENIITLDLTKVSEQAKWNLTWEEGCNPPVTEPRFSSQGLELGPCGCVFKNYASRSIKIPLSMRYLEIEVCSRLSGGDGIILLVTIDNRTYSYYIESSKCEQIYINITEFADNRFHVIQLSSERNGVCDFEVLAVKKLSLAKEVKIVDEPNLIKKQWKWEVYSPCKLYWLNNFIVTDKCYCSQSSYASTIVDFERRFPYLNLEVCAGKGGNDGVLAEIIIDNKVYSFLVPSNSCINRSIFIDTEKEKINLTLTSEIYGHCGEERIFWKKITFESEPKGRVIEEGENVYYSVSKIDKWNSNNKACPADFREEGIITDVCECSSPAQASYYWKTKEDKSMRLRITACAFFAGGDGVIGEIYIDNDLFRQIFIKSNDCVTIEENINLKKGVHIITLQPKIYGNCFAEFVKWAEVVVE